MDQNNIVVIFTKTADDNLSELEKKYHLEENDKEWVEKTINNKKHNIEIITNLIRDFSVNNIAEKDFIDSLQKNLKLPEEATKNIFNDAVNKIIPFLIKTTEEKLKDKKFVKEISKQSSEPFSAAQSKDKKKEEPITAMPVQLINEEKNQNNIIEKPIIIEKPPAPIKVKKKVIKEEVQKLPQKPDNYREPIE